MDSIENSLKIAQQYESLASSSQTQLNEDINAEKFSNLLKLYEYQIVEMQHEYELLLEDKIIVDKLLDNQMRIFSKYQNLSNEKTLIQQFNALNQEMDLLQLQLSKVNQLLNDTIAEKCKQELIYQQQQQKSSYHQQQQNQSQPQQQQHQQQSQFSRNSNVKSDTSSSLFRASLVPVGVGAVNSSSDANSKTAPSLWKANSPMFIHKKLNHNLNHFNSNENLNSLDSKDFSQQANGPTSYKSSNGELTSQDLNKQNSFHQHHHYYYLNNNNNNNSNSNGGNANNTNMTSLNSKLESNSMSKSIDSIYSPPASFSSTAGSNNGRGNALNGIGNGGAFNQPIKKSQQTCEQNEDSQASTAFQPVNFTNNRPRQINVIHQPAQTQSFHQLNSLPQSQLFVAKSSNFKRDIIAEKKRSSIGKYPQNQNGNVCNYFFILF